MGAPSIPTESDAECDAYFAFKIAARNLADSQNKNEQRKREYADALTRLNAIIAPVGP